MPLTEEGITERWMVLWFPPDAAERQRTFATVDAARNFARSEDVADWNPLIEHQITTVITELVPIEERDL